MSKTLVYWMLLFGLVTTITSLSGPVEWYIAVMRGIGIGLICYVIAEFYALVKRLVEIKERGLTED